MYIELRPNKKMTQGQRDFATRVLAGQRLEEIAEETGRSLGHCRKLLNAPYMQNALHSASIPVYKSMLDAELAKMAFSNVADYLSEEDEVLSMRSLPRHQSAAVKKLKRKVTYTKDGDEIHETDFELYDKLGAIKQLASSLGYEKPIQVDLTGHVTHDHEHSGTVTVEMLQVQPIPVGHFFDAKGTLGNIGTDVAEHLGISVNDWSDADLVPVLQQAQDDADLFSDHNKNLDWCPSRNEWVPAASGFKQRTNKIRLDQNGDFITD